MRLVLFVLYSHLTHEQDKLVENIFDFITGREGQYLAASIMTRKICSYCGKRKNKGSFPKHSMYKDNLDSRCKKCVKKQCKVRGKLHKKAPPRPEFCECCKKIPLKWCLDHDHSDDSFRGWICERCNTGLGKLGDNLEGIVNAMNYLIAKKNDKYIN